MHTFLRKVLSLFTAVIVVLSLIQPVFASFNDVQNHWAKDAIERLIIKGYPEGTFKPQNPITRVEFATIINSLLKLRNASDIAYKDVKQSDWYYQQVRLASNYMNGYPDLTFRPNKPLTRQETVTILDRVFDITPASNKVPNFMDNNQIADWAKDAVNALYSAGYIKGYSDNTFRPNSYITRAEAVYLISEIAKQIYSKEGEYTSGKILGNVIINTANVTLKDTEISGNLYITEGVGDGDVTIENVKVDGKVIVSGGGEQSVKIKNATINQLKIDKKGTPVRVVAEGNTNVKLAQVISSAKIEDNSQKAGFAVVTIENSNKPIEVELKGYIASVKISGEAVVKTTPDTQIENLRVEASDATLSLEGSVNKLEVANANNVVVSEKANVKELVVNSEEAKVTIQGTVEFAQIAAAKEAVIASNAKVEKLSVKDQNANIKVDGTVNTVLIEVPSAKINNQEVKKGDEVKIEKGGIVSVEKQSQQTQNTQNNTQTNNNSASTSQQSQTSTVAQNTTSNQVGNQSSQTQSSITTGSGQTSSSGTGSTNTNTSNQQTGTSSDQTNNTTSGQAGSQSGQTDSQSSQTGTQSGQTGSQTGQGNNQQDQTSNQTGPTGSQSDQTTTPSEQGNNQQGQSGSQEGNQGGQQNTQKPVNGKYALNINIKYSGQPVEVNGSFAIVAEDVYGRPRYGIFYPKVLLINTINFYSDFDFSTTNESVFLFSGCMENVKENVASSQVKFVIKKESVVLSTYSTANVEVNLEDYPKVTLNLSKDKIALGNAQVLIKPQKDIFSNLWYIGNTDENGNIDVFMSPGTYTIVVRYTESDGNEKTVAIGDVTIPAEKVQTLKLEVKPQSNITLSANIPDNLNNINLRYYYSLSWSENGNSYHYNFYTVTNSVYYNMPLKNKYIYTGIYFTRYLNDKYISYGLMKDGIADSDYCNMVFDLNRFTTPYIDYYCYINDVYKSVDRGTVYRGSTLKYVRFGFANENGEKLSIYLGAPVEVKIEDLQTNEVLYQNSNFDLNKDTIYIDPQKFVTGNKYLLKISFDPNWWPLFNGDNITAEFTVIDNSQSSADTGSESSGSSSGAEGMQQSSNIAGGSLSINVKYQSQPVDAKGTIVIGYTSSGGQTYNGIWYVGVPLNTVINYSNYTMLDNSTEIVWLVTGYDKSKLNTDLQNDIDRLPLRFFIQNDTVDLTTYSSSSIDINIEDYPEVTININKDGFDLENAQVLLEPTGSSPFSNFMYVGKTDSNGDIKIYISPGKYTLAVNYYENNMPKTVVLGNIIVTDEKVQRISLNAKPLSGLNINIIKPESLSDINRYGLNYGMFWIENGNYYVQSYYAENTDEISLYFNDCMKNIGVWYRYGFRRKNIISADYTLVEENYSLNENEFLNLNIDLNKFITPIIFIFNQSDYRYNWVSSINIYQDSTIKIAGIGFAADGGHILNIYPYVPLELNIIDPSNNEVLYQKSDFRLYSDIYIDSKKFIAGKKYLIRIGFDPNWWPVFKGNFEIELNVISP